MRAGTQTRNGKVSNVYPADYQHSIVTSKDGSSSKAQSTKTIWIKSTQVNVDLGLNFHM